MQKLTIKKVVVSDKGKDGKPFMGKFGPYKRIAIQVAEPDYEGKWLSGFITKESDPKNNIREGDVVELTVWEKNGYLNFDIPKEEERMKEAIDDLYDIVEELERRVKDLETKAIKNLAAVARELKPKVEEELPF